MPKGIYQHKSRSEDVKKRISEKLISIGHKPPKFQHTKKWRKKMSILMKNRIFSKEHRERIRLSKLGKSRPDIAGKNNHNWKGGITLINEKIRKSPEYKLWREAVFKRDNWICIWCGKYSGRLNADHIKPFSLFPELRFAIDNGRTLCIPCHKKTNSYGFKKGYRPWNKKML